MIIYDAFYIISEVIMWIIKFAPGPHLKTVFVVFFNVIEVTELRDTIH